MTPNTGSDRSTESAGVDGRPPDLLDELLGDVSRRSFLRLVGFGVGAAALPSCSRGPERQAIPYAEPPEGIVPGLPYWIATTSNACGAGCGVLARCRDGRPVKLEGNPDHPLNRGGLCPTCQASVLSLYDSHRLSGPRLDGATVGWGDVDAFVAERLDGVRRDGGRVRLLTSTLNGPSTVATVERFVAGFDDARHVVYDARSASAIGAAHEAAFGVRAWPRVDFASARVIAALDDDFLGAGVSPESAAHGWAAGRRPDAEVPLLSHHWQLEARLSPTGARADRRVRVAPWETAAVVAGLAARIGARAGQTQGLPAPDALPPHLAPLLDDLADELWAEHGASVVVCGTNDRALQTLVCRINDLLGAYGSTLDLVRPSLQRLGDDRALEALRDELLAGDVDLLVVQGGNPAYDVPGFAEAIAAAGTVVSCASGDDETAALAHAVCPEPHDLERWDDVEPAAGVYGLLQPTLQPLREVRTLRATLARWAGDEREDRELLRAHWRTELYPRSSGHATFDGFFDSVLERGFVELSSSRSTSPGPFRLAALDGAPRSVTAPGPDALGLVLYPKIAILDGRGALNPWLQELPDPISKSTWGHEACLAPATAERLGLSDGDVLRLSSEQGPELELPVLVQPGQHDDVVAVALGYGRRGTDRFTNVGPDWMFAEPTVAPGGTIGVNAAPLQQLGGGELRTDVGRVALATTGATVQLARTQDYERLELPAHLAPAGHEVRDAVRTIALSDWAGAAAEGGGHGEAAGLWPDDHTADGHRWGVVVDLAACTGCSACVVACQAENNVPVVGRDEVRRHREMSWLRIDRYYAGDGDELSVARQPMMCQHCAQAPCETVCPVLATVHSSEGINAQVYNRCVGTRYCANNCPYKVRRFNWFDYERESPLENMVLNPDVTVRSRGVMEKCSLCVQRIQAAKARARVAGEPLADGDIQLACQQSCPTQAITFGDLNDPESRVARGHAAPRAYTVLEELNVRPIVRYLADVRHDGPEEARHG